MSWPASKGTARVKADTGGRVVDFHSLRVSFITQLSVAKVHPRTAQALARHSKIELTMRTYVDDRMLDLRGAVESVGAAGLDRSSDRHSA